MDVTKTSGGDSNIAAQIESLMAKLLNELAEIREKITKVEQRIKGLTQASQNQQIRIDELERQNDELKAKLR